MKPTARDKVLLAILPGILIIAIYGLLLSSVPMDEYKAAKKAYDNAVKNMPSHTAILEQETKLDGLKKKMKVLKAESDELQDMVDGMRDRLAQSQDSTETVAQLTDLLNRNGLILLDEGPESGSGEHASQLAGIMNKLSQSIATASDTGKNQRGPTLWKVRFIGRYIDVIAALHEINESDTLIIPVSIAMEEVRGEGTIRSWTLFVWV